MPNLEPASSRANFLNHRLVALYPGSSEVPDICLILHHDFDDEEHQPVHANNTSGCKHIFCRACVVEHCETGQAGDKCPMCRALWYYSPASRSHLWALVHRRTNSFTGFDLETRARDWSNRTRNAPYIGSAGSSGDFDRSMSPSPEALDAIAGSGVNFRSRHRELADMHNGTFVRGHRRSNAISAIDHDILLAGSQFAAPPRVLRGARVYNPQNRHSPRIVHQTSTHEAQSAVIETIEDGDEHRERQSRGEPIGNLLDQGEEQHGNAIAYLSAFIVNSRNQLRNSGTPAARGGSPRGHTIGT